MRSFAIGFSEKINDESEASPWTAYLHSTAFPSSLFFLELIHVGQKDL